MEAPISQKEIKDVLKKTKNNKTPGPDGFPVEFYRHFCHLLNPHLENLFNEILNRGSMPKSWKEATIVTIPKQSKDQTDPATYRLVALLNQDYKLLTGIIANRLNNIISFFC